MVYLYIMSACRVQSGKSNSVSVYMVVYAGIASKLLNV